MSDDGSWSCPACRYAGSAAADLVAHLQREHRPATTRARREVVWWRCPLAGCPKHDVWFQDSAFLCAHLREHLPGDAGVPEPVRPSMSSATRSARPGERARIYIEAGLGKLPDPQVARALGVTKATVQHVRKRLNIPSHREVRGAETEKELLSLLPRIRALAREGYSRYVIAGKLGIPWRKMYLPSGSHSVRDNRRPASFGALVEDIFRDDGVPRSTPKRSQPPHPRVEAPEAEPPADAAVVSTESESGLTKRGELLLRLIAPRVNFFERQGFTPTEIARTLGLDLDFVREALELDHA